MAERVASGLGETKEIAASLTNTVLPHFDCEISERYAVYQTLELTQGVLSKVVTSKLVVVSLEESDEAARVRPVCHWSYENKTGRGKQC